MADEDREVAAAVLDGVAGTAELIGSSVGGPVGAAISMGAALAKIVAALTRSLGASTAKKTLEELKRRVDAGEGLITDADLTEDDEYVDAYIDRLFGPKT